LEVTPRGREHDFDLVASLVADETAAFIVMANRSGLGKFARSASSVIADFCNKIGTEKPAALTRNGSNRFGGIRKIAPRAPRPTVSH
jgi:hypothetical protein